MLLLINNSDILDLERATIKNGTSAQELMSRAVSTFLSWFTHIQSATCHVDVICGKGNNGADGFLIAKGLFDRGYRVRILACRHNTRETVMPLTSYRSLILEKTDILISDISQASDLMTPMKGAVLIDALLGNGINRSLTGPLSQIVARCNDLYEDIYAVDTPSGLGDFEGTVDLAMKCTATLAFEYPKVSFFNPEVEKYTGSWSFTSIGLDKPPLGSFSSKTHLVQSDDVRKIIDYRDFASHKGDLGRVLHIIGHNNMMGAGILAANATLAAGAGLTYAYSIGSIAPEVHPEIAWIKDIRDQEVIGLMDVIVIGPGLGRTKESKECLDQILQLDDVKLILDADALNIIADEDWLSRIPIGTILTPHIGEFKRLFPGCKTHKSRISKQKEVCEKMGITIVLKGPYTSTCDSDGHIYYNTTGNPSLAKGGSGDILTGVIASLRARHELNAHEVGYSSAYIHGLAADLYVEDHHESTLTPNLLIKYIDKSMLKLST